MTTFSRIRVEIAGIVQGVGFRPFIFRLASRHSLGGWVCNSPAGVVLEAEGRPAELAAFIEGISAEAPPLAAISALEKALLAPLGERQFHILPSVAGENQIQIAPDGDVCAACLEELFSPADRRFRYPFINCTNCGPRYSIITGIPYDRPLTTMARFTMCAPCRAEYENPHDRRFHAQPNACPDCGPRLRLTAADGVLLAGDPLDRGGALLQEGRILAIKGIGGYHLAVDPCSDRAVAELRRRKGRDEKPFALMARNLAAIEPHAHCSELEKRLLGGPERPIILLGKRDGSPLSPLVAPGNSYLGMMLPATPLQHLLLRDHFPVLLMTSGNQSDEPVLYRDDEAFARLAGIADFFLGHDRAIENRCDDSVIRVFQGNPLFLRRARGYVPRAIALAGDQRSVLAVGGELKSAVCLTRGDRAFLSPHIGDLKNSAVQDSLAKTVTNLSGMLGIEPQLVAHDLHPDYLSTGFAGQFAGVPKLAVQHHHAHLAACMAENRLDGEVIGVVFDGTGFGLDGAVWGGEFLHGGYRSFRRCGHFRYVPLPGGDAAAQQPFRMALAYLHDQCGDRLFDLALPCLAGVSTAERSIFLAMLAQGVNSPPTSSCGRLFDAVAALVMGRTVNAYEGHAAIELEGVAERGTSAWNYPYALRSGEDGFQIDFRLLIGAILQDMSDGEAVATIARRFHDTLAAVVVDACGRISEELGERRVALSGGVFQNKLLTERVIQLLTGKGFQVYSHRLCPPNDGGLALGQAVIAGYSTAPFP